MIKTILVIDDDKKLNQLLKDFLGDFGFHTLTATHPAEGLTKLRQKSPDLVILDVMLPEINGFEVCKRLKADSKLASVPVIMMTSRDYAEDVLNGLELGAIDYIPKDAFAEAVLLETIKQMAIQTKFCIYSAILAKVTDSLWAE